MRKKCGRCGVLKDTTEYHKESRTRDGLQAWCKECQATYQRRFRGRFELVDVKIPVDDKGRV